MSDLRLYIAELRYLIKEALMQGREFEQKAEQARMEAEQAFADVGAMKEEGRQRMIDWGQVFLTPASTRSTDVRTNTFKAVGDAKGDFLLYLGSVANTYATLAQMKYAKAAALNAEILTWQNSG